MKKIFTHTLAVLLPAERRRFAMQVTADIVMSVLDIVFLALLLFIINFYTQPAASNKLSFLPSWLLNNNSLLLITIFLLLFSVKNLLSFFIYRAQSKFVCRVAGRLSANKLTNYLEGSYMNYINTDSAAHIRRISHQSVDFCQQVLGGIQQIITQTALIVFTITAMLLFNAKLFLILFAILLPPIIIVLYIIKSRLRVARSQAQTNIEKTLQYLHEALNGFVESNIYQKNNFFLQRYIQYQQQFNKYLADIVVVQGIPARMMEIFALLGLFILVAINKWGAAGNSASIIAVGAFMAAAYKIIPGIVKVLNTIGQIKNYEFTIPDVLENGVNIITTNNDIASQHIHNVSLQNVSFSYNDHTIINNLSFAVEQGDFMGIAGQSGKGKTTVLHLLLGFLSPNNGNILYNNAIGTDTASKKQYWKYIAYVKQQSFLLHDTILQNIVLDDQTPDEKRLARAIEMAGLSPLVESFPKKLQQVIAENGKNISGGQRQRIAIARTLYKEADMIILDEPFNELDEASEKTLLSHFKNLSVTGKIVILITHNKDSLSYCNKIVSLDE